MFSDNGMLAGNDMLSGIGMLAVAAPAASPERSLPASPLAGGGRNGAGAAPSAAASDGLRSGPDSPMSAPSPTRPPSAVAPAAATPARVPVPQRRYDLADPPKPVRAVLLRHAWHAPLCTSEALCQMRYHCCVRCDVAQLWHATKEAASSDTATREPTRAMERIEPRVLCFIAAADVLSLGSPCGACVYQGLGTAVYGCWVRWLVRKQFAVDGVTWLDCAAMLCCPGCAMRQQHEQMAQAGIQIPEPSSMT